jgi:Zn-dependent oligopeptidase
LSSPYSERRDLRRRVWEAFVTRGDNGNERDNKKIIAEIVSCAASARSCWDTRATRTGASR